MQTLAVIVAGLVLLGLFLVGAHLAGHALPAAMRLFVPIWFLATVANLWVGVTEAGYTAVEELPILLLVFGVPAGAALIASRLARGRSAP
ncbi:MAG TPA: hypothetical protein VIL69_05325 [Roseomonas sp.]